MYGDKVLGHDPSVPEALSMRNSAGHPGLCSGCRRKLDSNWINPTFRVKNRKRDITATYDGYTLVSERFRSIWEKYGHAGAIFRALPADPYFFALGSNQILEFDSAWRKTRFEDYCSICKAFATVVGANPVRLKNITDPLAPGLYRTDIEFASDIEQHPLMIVDPLSYSILKAERLVGLGFDSIEVS